MYKLFGAILAGLLAGFGLQPDDCDAVQMHTFDDLLDAIAQVESSGNSRVFNVLENAAGLYQIRPIYLADVNRLIGYRKYTLLDRFDPVKARQIVTIYLRHYGKGKSLEAMARIHNGGPAGWRKACTKKY